MSFNPTEIKRLFNAGIATVALNSPTASELAVTQQIAQSIAHPQFDLLIWDAAKSLQKLERPGSRNRCALNFKAVENYHPQGHPVEALLKYIEQACLQPTSNPVLFLLKDVYPYITGANPNPALVRLGIDAFFAAKRSPNRIIILHDSMTTPRVFQDLVADVVNPLPNETETQAILEFRLQALQQSAAASGVEFPVHLDDNDNKRLVRALLGMTHEAMDDSLQLCAITHSGFDSNSPRAIDEIKKAKYAARGIQFAKIPDVEVQGLPILQQWATQITALLEPQAKELYNLPFPKGALIVGVGGTGKTLSVKCFAKEWGLPVIALDVGELMSKELGASEANLREAIAVAESLSPCILFADEMDKMFPGTTTSQSDGGTSQRMFGYFLKWFSESTASVFVAATANRPWHFKPELLRRFTKVFYVDVPCLEAREQIWQVMLDYYRLNLMPEDIHLLANESVSFTGDEIRKVVEHCAGMAYATRRPLQVTLQDLLTQVRAKPPQFGGTNPELEALRTWAHSGQATWAAPFDSTDGVWLTNSDRSLNWNSSL